MTLNCSGFQLSNKNDPTGDFCVGPTVHFSCESSVFTYIKLCFIRTDHMYLWMQIYSLRIYSIYSLKTFFLCAVEYCTRSKTTSLSKAHFAITQHVVWMSVTVPLCIYHFSYFEAAFHTYYLQCNAFFLFFAVTLTGIKTTCFINIISVQIFSQIYWLAPCVP